MDFGGVDKHRADGFDEGLFLSPLSPLGLEIKPFSPSLSLAIERVNEHSDVRVSKRSASTTANASVNLMTLPVRGVISVERICQRKFYVPAGEITERRKTPLGV